MDAFRDKNNRFFQMAATIKKQKKYNIYKDEYEIVLRTKMMFCKSLLLNSAGGSEKTRKSTSTQRSPYVKIFQVMTI